MNIVLIGAGGHGRVVLEIIQLAGEHRPVGFIDADARLVGSTVAGLPVVGAINQLPKLRRQDIAGAVVAIGDNRVRLSYAALVLESGLELVNAIHPSATISPAARIGRNVVIAAGSIIGTDAVVNDSVLVNTAASIDHECRIGPGVHVCPGVLLAGRVQVDEGAFVGMGAKILPCLKVGRWAIVGAGAVVREDVPPETTVVGVPARTMEKNRQR